MRTMEKINHPNHYQGSCAESWDLTVLEWGPEYAIAAWVIQAQQYYDRHKEKNGNEDLYKAIQFLDHAVKIRDKLKSHNIWIDMNTSDYWQKVDMLRGMIEKEINETEGKAL